MIETQNNQIISHRKVNQVGVGLRSEPTWIKYSLIGTAYLIFGIFFILPLAFILSYALQKGWDTLLLSIADTDALSAVWLTLKIAALCVLLNTIFGIAAAWAITKFRFRGKQLLITLIDLPFSVSPVVVGLLFVLVFGKQGWFGEALANYDIKIIFAFPGMLLATLFVTFPFVVRELLPLMESLGNDEEEAAMVLGATGWKIFSKVTLPNIKWALAYGIILCSARAIGEFGAVSVVSGHIRGQTNTLPLHIEILYNEYQFIAAFGFASLMVIVALIILLIKTWIEHRLHEQLTKETP